VIIPNMNSVMV